MAGYEDNTLDAETLALFANAPERFVRKLRREGACVVWAAARFKTGYGAVWTGEKVECAHRYSYILAKGEIPHGMDIMHSCDNRPCVNPAHLSAGTRQANMQDCVDKKRQTYGERNPMAKMTEALVLEIRRRFADGERQIDLAKAFGLSKPAICNIVRNQRWKHLLET